MLKIKSQVKKLGFAVALGLLSSTASALPLHSTLNLPFIGGDGLNVGDWAAARFQVDAGFCPTGCNVTGASLDLFSDAEPFPDRFSLAGYSLSVYSAGANDSSIGETKLFSFETSIDMVAGDRTTVDFEVKDGENTLLSNSAFYWLRLDNDSHDFGLQWSFDSNEAANEHSILNTLGETFEFTSPYLFEVQGVASAVPVPGAVWMMGSALLGLLGVRRKSNKMTPAI